MVLCYTTTSAINWKDGCGSILLDGVDLASAVASLTPEFVVVAAEDDEATILEADRDQLTVGTCAHRACGADANTSHHFLQKIHK